MSNKECRGFTLLEMLIVVVIIAVLAALALPNYFGMKEREYDRDAGANLKLIMAAQKIYRMETGVYDARAYGNIDTINNILRLSLPSGTTKLWDYRTVSDNMAAPPTTCVEAQRSGTARTLRFRNTEDEPVGNYDNPPNSQTCP